MKKWKRIFARQKVQANKQTLVRIICLATVFCLIVTSAIWMIAGTKTAYGATCPEKGHEDWDYKWICGCSVCGGKYVNYEEWNRNPIDPDGRYLTDDRAGDGFIRKTYATWTMEDGKGDTYTNVTVTYRCYNCGYRSWDGTIYNRNNFEVWDNVISFTGTDSDGDPVLEEEERAKGPQHEANGGKGEGSGAVPWYECKFCLGRNVGSYKHGTCHTITAKVSDARGGTVSFSGGTEGRVKMNQESGSSISAILGPGASITITAAVNSGYRFNGWSSGEETERITVTAAADRAYTAKVALPAANTPTPAPATPKPTAEPTPEPTEPPEGHIHEYGDWVYDGSSHWKECPCGETAEKAAHGFTSGTPDADGTTLYTCKTCGYSYTAHKHEWIGWCCEDCFDDTYDAEAYHWKICAYDSCGKTSSKGKHVKGGYVDEGCGYLVARCTVCRWVMDERPVTVSLTLDPNGGSFPDGSTGPAVFEDIGYGQPTTLGRLPSEYFPAKDGKTFAGWFFVSPEGDGCVYMPDESTKTCIGGSRYFEDNGDGTYTSRMSRDYVLYAQWKDIEYTVEYDGNGAEGLMFPSYHRVGEPKALNPNGYYFTSRITYQAGGVSATIAANSANTTVAARFLGWAGEKDGMPLYADGETVMDLIGHSGTVVLYACFDYGSVILPDAAANAGGYRLAGWRKTDGSVISVVDAEGLYKEVTYPVHGSETLTAVWEANRYTVSFDSNGGSACAPIAVTYGNSYGTLPTPSNTGHTFRGWYTQDTGEPVTSATKVARAGNHTLIAGWSPDVYTVTLDWNFDYKQAAVNPEKNHETQTPDVLEVSFHGYYVGLPEPVRDGYAFAGWYDSEDGGNGSGNRVTAATRVTGTADHTLHARWVQNTYTVTFDYNMDYSVWEEDSGQ